MPNRDPDRPDWDIPLGMAGLGAMAIVGGVAYTLGSFSFHGFEFLPYWPRMDGWTIGLSVFAAAFGTMAESVIWTGRATRSFPFSAMWRTVPGAITAAGLLVVLGSCRSRSAAPVNAFTLWTPENVKVTKGAALVGHFMKTKMSDRQYCTKCGGHLMTGHPSLGLVAVHAATVPSAPFRPGIHVNYGETVLPMKDGLPKLKDFPAEFGGSGTVVPE